MPQESAGFPPFSVLPQLRLALLVLLVALPAGCLGGAQPDCATCAKPTDKPATCPNCSVAPPRPPDLNDPGYSVTATWDVGDGWDYYSNLSRYHSDRVIDERSVNGTTYFLIDEAVGLIGNAPQQHVRTWYDGANWTRVNVTYVGGTIMTNYTPPQPDRFFRNGTFAYNQSDGNKGTTTRWAFVVNAYFGDSAKESPWQGYQSVALPWGATLAAHVEYRALRTASDATTTREFTVRWVSASYANDVQYQLANGETFKLVAARVAGKQYGTMIPRSDV